MKSKLVIHIGYPKTGTTTIQKHIFNLPLFGNINLNLRQLEQITLKNEIGFKDLLKELTTYIENEKKALNKNINIISSETLTSVSTFFRFKPYPFIWSPDPVSIARKLKLLVDNLSEFNEIKVVIVIRKQSDFIKSNYAQMYNLVYKRFRQTKTFEKFIEYSFNTNYDNFIGAAINYNKIILEYEDLFERENIKVLVFEDLLNEPVKYAEAWSDILDCSSNMIFEKLKIKENVKGFDKKFKLQRTNLVQYLANNPKLNWLNFVGNKDIKLFFKKHLRKIKFGEGDISLNISNEKEIMEYYINDNKELSERYNLNLKKYNYY